MDSPTSNWPFTGATEGSSATVNGLTAYYTYEGDTGQNFTLTASGGPQVLSDGTLTLECVDSGLGGYLQLLQGTSVIASVPTASVTGTFTVQADAANTTLTIDYTAGGYFQKDVDFVGSDATNTLVIKGNPNGGFGNTTYTYTGAHSGTIKNYSDAAGTLLLNTITYPGPAAADEHGHGTLPSLQPARRRARCPAGQCQRRQREAEQCDQRLRIPLPSPTPSSARRP